MTSAFWHDEPVAPSGFPVIVDGDDGLILFSFRIGLESSNRVFIEVRSTNLVYDTVQLRAIAENTVILFFLRPFQMGEVVEDLSYSFHRLWTVNSMVISLKYGVHENIERQFVLERTARHCEGVGRQSDSWQGSSQNRSCCGSHAHFTSRVQVVRAIRVAMRVCWGPYD